MFLVAAAYNYPTNPKLAAIQVLSAALQWVFLWK